MFIRGERKVHTMLFVEGGGGESPHTVSVSGRLCHCKLIGGKNVK